MTTLMNPLVFRMALLLFTAFAAFCLGLFTIRHLRKSLVAEPESFDHTPLAAEGMPVHAYHAVIQQLKQQKHELAAQQLSERRKAKASDALSSTILSNLSCGVLFFNSSGLVRQANSTARDLLGFASPIGLHLNDLFRTASLRPESSGALAPTLGHSTVAQMTVAQVTVAQMTVEQAIAPALAGSATVRGLVVNYVSREDESQILEMTASPVLSEDATVMGATLVLTDRTDIERIRHDQRMHQEISAEMARGLRNSLATIAGSAQQLATGRDPEKARELADNIALEAARLDRTIGSFLGGAHSASTSS